MKESKYKIDPNCWTMDFYNIAYEKLKNEKIPVVIPSYNRWNRSSTLDQIKKYKKYSWPIYVVVRESQKSLYEENYGDIEDMTILGFEDSQIDNIAKTRVKIVETFSDYKSIFVLDDDIRIVLKSKATYIDSNGEEHNRINAQKLDSGYSDPARLLAMWQLCHEYLTDKYEDECWSTFLKVSIWTKDVYNIEDKSYSLGGNAAQAICLNLDIMDANNLRYNDSDEDILEDAELTFHAMTLGLYPISLNFENYISDLSNSVICSQLDFDNFRERFVYQNQLMKEMYSHFRFIKLNTHNTFDFRWINYFKALGIYDRHGSIRHEVYDKLVD